MYLEGVILMFLLFFNIIKKYIVQIIIINKYLNKSIEKNIMQ